MEVFSGNGVSGGVAIGKLAIYHRKPKEITNRYVEDVSLEIGRFEEAKKKTAMDLERLYQKALSEVGEKEAAIFEVHKMMLEDPQFCDSVKAIIQKEQINAEVAVNRTMLEISKTFEAMDSEYMRERVADIRDVSRRLSAILSGDDNDGVNFTEPSILLADDLMPSETMQLERDKILGFITQKGSMNSHTAILARTMNIPAVVGTVMDISDAYEGMSVIADGFDGKVYLQPDKETLSKMREKRKKDTERKELLNGLKGKESVTLDGRKVELFANIGNPEDVVNVISNDAEGVGLFRSEFIYLEKDHYPTEEEQFTAYKKVAEKMAGKKVIIRTLDIGADKKVDYFNLDQEENPALGYRAIRICLDRKELFRTQLRAIYRASCYGAIAIMFPMIISLEEVLAIKKIVKTVKAELKAEGIPFHETELGIMIETPAAAVISDILADEVDFFSIGTNDLTQYTLAIDRQNRKLDKIYDRHHPAVLRLIELVTKNAHAKGIKVGICGELGADLTLTETFLRMGIDELSVSPGKILELRKKVRETNLKE